jgi:hypothetical protein
MSIYNLLHHSIERGWGLLAAGLCSLSYVAHSADQLPLLGGLTDLMLGTSDINNFQLLENSPEIYF